MWIFYAKLLHTYVYAYTISCLCRTSYEQVIVVLSDEKNDKFNSTYINILLVEKLEDDLFLKWAWDTIRRISDHVYIRESIYSWKNERKYLRFFNERNHDQDGVLVFQSPACQQPQEERLSLKITSISFL